MVKHTFTALPVLAFLIPAKSSKNTTIDKSAVMIGNQLPYPKGSILKYEKYFVTRSVGPGAKVIAIPKGVAIKIIVISTQHIEIVFFNIVYFTIFVTFRLTTSLALRRGWACFTVTIYTARNLFSKPVD